MQNCLQNSKENSRKHKIAVISTKYSAINQTGAERHECFSRRLYQQWQISGCYTAPLPTTFNENAAAIFSLLICIREHEIVQCYEVSKQSLINQMIHKQLKNAKLRVTTDTGIGVKLQTK
jgi:hypothetical protein